MPQGGIGSYQVAVVANHGAEFTEADFHDFKDPVLFVAECWFGGVGAASVPCETPINSADTISLTVLKPPEREFYLDGDYQLGVRVEDVAGDPVAG